MNRMAIAALIAFGSVSAGAAQQAPEPTTTQAPALTPAATPQTQADSPLVRAAKASVHATTTSKTKKKKLVITNDTLVKSGGHITTTNQAQAPLPQAAQAAAGPKTGAPAPNAATAAKDDEEGKRRAAARANAVYEGEGSEGLFEDPSTSKPPPAQPPAAPAKPPM